MTGTEQLLIALATVIISALAAPWFARRATANENARLKAENDERRANTAEASQIKRLFDEQDQMRKQYREDIAGHRQDIADLRSELKQSDDRVRALEQEVAEWRAGVRGVHGVWIAVPSSVWSYVRDRLPELPPTRFPGEVGGDLPPADL